MDIETRQLLFDSGVPSRILRHHAASFEYRQKVAKCRLQVMTNTSDRIGADACRQMFREKANDGDLTDHFQAVPLLCQPMGEVRDAAHVGALGARSISPSLQMLPVLRNVRLKNTSFQPSARPWLYDDHLLHTDLLLS
ncbi:MAG: hypothetical protein DI607_12310 [Sphingomonas hengshuiensis]|nr:MAG: hypothetical protein DI607_12310 [Sphingomonas hengshuiensis]